MAEMMSGQQYDRIVSLLVASKVARNDREAEDHVREHLGSTLGAITAEQAAAYIAELEAAEKAAAEPEPARANRRPTMWARRFPWRSAIGLAIAAVVVIVGAIALFNAAEDAGRQAAVAEVKQLRRELTSDAKKSNMANPLVGLAARVDSALQVAHEAEFELAGVSSGEGQRDQLRYRVERTERKLGLKPSMDQDEEKKAGVAVATAEPEKKEEAKPATPAQPPVAQAPAQAPEPKAVTPAQVTPAPAPQPQAVAPAPAADPNAAKLADLLKRLRQQ